MEKMMPIFQIVGYKKSGKTSFIKKLVKQLSKRGMRVGVIKHHGHGGAPEILEPEHTDTAQFEKSGACVTAVEGDGHLYLKVTGMTSIALEQIVAMYRLLPLDLILIEGYKQASYPKFIMIKDMEDLKRLLDACNNVKGMVDNSDVGSRIMDSDFPIFRFSEPGKLIDYMLRS